MKSLAMNIPARIPSIQSYQLLLYRRALHPELFPLRQRRLIQHGRYELEAWIMPGGHLLRFRANGFACCELVIDQEGNLPIEGAVTAFPVAGEHDFSHTFPVERVGYVTSVQTETLSDSLYQATFAEMIEFARDTGALIHHWNEGNGAGNGAGKNLSVLDIQRLSKEVHAQSFHLVAAGGVVIRTQTIFEHQ